MKAALLLAAGLSTRFFGPNKLLFPYRDRPLIGWAAEAFGQAPVDRRILVTGRDDRLIIDAVQTYCPAQFDIVHNDNPEEGFAHSLRRGLNAVAMADWVMPLMADMPDITGTIIEHIFEAIEPDAYAVVPAFVGTWGNPMILSAEAAGDANSLTGENTPLSLLQARRADVVVANVLSDAVLRDIDRPSDMLSLEALEAVLPSDPGPIKEPHSGL